jgi:hypothetical protein
MRRKPYGDILHQIAELRAPGSNADARRSPVVRSKANDERDAL